jgi:hypothetical protein
MLIHELSETEQAAFLQLARRLADVDGVQSPLEEVLLETFQRAAYDGAGDVEDAGTEELCETFQTRRARVAALLELTAFGHVDDQFTANESLLLEEVADYWNMTDGALDRADQWARRQYALVDDADDFWE